MHVSVTGILLYIFSYNKYIFSFIEKGSDGLRKLLHFITGLSTIPPLGLKQQIEVEFHSNSKSFFAETCVYVLKVPINHDSFEDFMEKVYEACGNSQGFGCV